MTESVMEILAQDSLKKIITQTYEINHGYSSHRGCVVNIVTVVVPLVHDWNRCCLVVKARYSRRDRCDQTVKILLCVSCGWYPIRQHSRYGLAGVVSWSLCLCVCFRFVQIGEFPLRCWPIRDFRIPTFRLFVHSRYFRSAILRTVRIFQAVVWSKPVIVRDIQFFEARSCAVIFDAFDDIQYFDFTLILRPLVFPVRILTD